MVSSYVLVILVSRFTDRTNKIQVPVDKQQQIWQPVQLQLVRITQTQTLALLQAQHQVVVRRVKAKRLQHFPALAQKPTQLVRFPQLQMHLANNTTFYTNTPNAAVASSSIASSSTSSSSSSTSALGGIPAPPVTNSGDSSRPFSVNGNTFVNEGAALQRSCDIQFNACANAFNGGTAKGFDIGDCQTQQEACVAG